MSACASAPTSLLPVSPKILARIYAQGDLSEEGEISLFAFKGPPASFSSAFRFLRAPGMENFSPACSRRMRRLPPEGAAYLRIYTQVTIPFSALWLSRRSAIRFSC